MQQRDPRLRADGYGQGDGTAGTHQLDVKCLERLPGTRRRRYQFMAIGHCTRILVLKVIDASSQRSAI
jgi:hypothetical protein